MAEKANKVKFNLKNTHYALLTIGEDGTPTFGTPVPMPGSVSISLDANGEPENFYADGGVYYVINNNCGYDGDLELALIPESFRTDVLKETLDSKGVLIENSEVELAAFSSDCVTCSDSSSDFIRSTKGAKYLSAHLMIQLDMVCRDIFTPLRSNSCSIR